MKQVAKLALALGLAASSAYAAGPPEWGDPAYQAPSTYIEAADIEAAAGRDVIFVFHGFRSAMPNKSHARARYLFRDDYVVIGVNYNYFDVQETTAYLKSLAAEFQDRQRVFTMGTSLGGYWARWLGLEIGATGIIMINPVVDPVQQLAHHAGQTFESERRAISFEVTEADVRNYEAAQLPEDGFPSTLILLTEDDEVIDHAVAVAAFAGHQNVQLVSFSEGGHTFDFVRHPAREKIEEFVRSKEAE